MGYYGLTVGQSGIMIAVEGNTMAAFIGTHIHTLDDKGRVSVPAQFRKRLTAEDMYLNVGMEGCLVLYPSERWHQLEEKLLEISRGSRKARYLRRKLAQNLRAVSLDSQGRISVPADLAEKAGITGEVLFLGQIDLMELWQPERYEAHCESQEIPLEDIAEDYDLPL